MGHAQTTRTSLHSPFPTPAPPLCPRPFTPPGKRLFKLARAETNLTDSEKNGQQLDFSHRDVRIRCASGPLWEIHERGLDLQGVRRLMFLDRITTCAHRVEAGS